MWNLPEETLYIQEGPSAGYLNFRAILETVNVPFIFIIGGRGTGKTFGGIQYILEENIPTMFMRRTQVQADKIGTPKMCPVKPVCAKMELDYKVTNICKDVKGIKFGESTQELMYTTALSTIHNLRGFSAEEIEILMLDEFIPEPLEKPIPNEGEALGNAYETINRNRELEGRKPLQFIGLSNSNKLDNPLFVDLGLVLAADKIFSEGLNLYYNKKRGCAIINLDNSPISVAKSTTALYNFMAGTDFAKMALENEFRDYKSPQKHFNLKQLTNIINVGEIGIYNIKGTDNIYICSLQQKAPVNLGNNVKGITAFYALGYAKGLWSMYLDNMVYFENYLCESLFKKYCVQSRKLI